MSVVVVSGSGGLVGLEAARFYAGTAGQVVGIDNDMRARFFGPEASTDWAVKQLRQTLDNYVEDRHPMSVRRSDSAAAATFILRHLGRGLASSPLVARKGSRDQAAFRQLTTMAPPPRGRKGRTA